MNLSASAKDRFRDLASGLTIQSALESMAAPKSETIRFDAPAFPPAANAGAGEALGSNLAPEEDSD